VLEIVCIVLQRNDAILNLVDGRWVMGEHRVEQRIRWRSFLCQHCHTGRVQSRRKNIQNP
jgi:hypothetical protein